MSCNRCRRSTCTGCTTTYGNYPCPSFPPPPGPTGPAGPTGPQGPPGLGSCPCPLTIVKVVGQFDLATPYNVTGLEDIILVDSTLGVVDIFLLAANNPLVIRRLYIKDAFGTSGIFPIVIHPIGLDTIDGIATGTDIFTTTGAPYGCIELVTNQINGYNII